ncbi:MAG: hypothetical protein WAZ94_13335 [Phycisphaerales bacterium]
MAEALSEKGVVEIRAAYDALAPIVLRDYFAGCALTGILGGRTMPLDRAEEGSEHAMSISAYIIADAMLEARKARTTAAGGRDGRQG